METTAPPWRVHLERVVPLRIRVDGRIVQRDVRPDHPRALGGRVHNLYGAFGVFGASLPSNIPFLQSRSKRKWHRKIRMHRNRFVDEGRVHCHFPSPILVHSTTENPYRNQGRKRTRVQNDIRWPPHNDLCLWPQRKGERAAVHLSRGRVCHEVPISTERSQR